MVEVQKFIKELLTPKVDIAYSFRFLKPNIRLFSCIMIFFSLLLQVIFTIINIKNNINNG